MSPSIKRYIVPAIIGVGAFIAIYYFFNPEEHIFPQCLFYRLTGWQCAGCGSQRMIHALLHGDIVAAWHYNAMILLASPILISMLVANLFKHKIPRFHKFIYSPWVVWTLVGSIMVWWILRNIF